MEFQRKGSGCEASCVLSGCPSINFSVSAKTQEDRIASRKHTRSPHCLPEKGETALKERWQFIHRLKFPELEAPEPGQSSVVHKYPET